MQISKSKDKQLSDNIPDYYLYGDRHLNDNPDFIHIERIQTKSKLYNWEIKAHQHRKLFQIVFFFTGTAIVRIDEQETKITAPTAITVPPTVVHGFRFQADTEGFVVTIAEPLIFKEVEQGHEQSLELLLSQTFTIELSEVPEQIERITYVLTMINDEFHSPQRGRSMMLRLLVDMLLLLLRRQLGEQHSEQKFDGISASIYNRYRALVEDNFRKHLQISDYAGILGLSGRHLNRLCRKMVGTSALDVIHGRLLLEAKRQLIYTTAPVTSLAFELGFQDPAYFSRFFRKNTGIAPGKFRLEQSNNIS